MMKITQIKYLIQISAFFILLSISTSCGDDYFELEQPPQTPWNNIDEFDRAPVGAYGVLFGSQEWVQSWPNYAVILTSLGDDVEFVNDNQWGYQRNTQAGTDLSNRNIWLVYRGIAAANAALDYVEANDGNPFPEATEDQIVNDLNRVIGELHFIRGFCYYMLQTTFGHAYVPGGDNSMPDLPLRTNHVTDIDDGLNPKIATTGEMWDFIRDEFLLAKELLPEKYLANVHDASFEVRANKYAAVAMLARTYFQRGEYSLSEEECDFIIQNGATEYNLTEDPIEAFSKSEYAERGAETIWYLPYSDKTLYPPNHLSVLNATWNGEQCQWNETRMGLSTIKRLGWMTDPLTDTTINLAAKRDKRFQQLIKVRYPASKAQEGQETDGRAEISNITTIWPFKYYRGPGQDFTNVPMIRLAEIYLTRSIIRFNRGDKGGAADDLNMVRRRAWDEVIGGAYVEVTAVTITAQMIHDERLIEMFNEADRLNYLRGLKVDVPQGERGAGSDPYTSEKFIWRIPQSETLYNGGIN